MQSFRKAAIAAALVASALTGGAIGASLLGTASAQESTDTTTSSGSSTAAATPDAGHDPSQGGHMANGITETLLTGDTADKVSAAALAAVPGGTIERVENDAEGATYEAHMVDADGGHVTVKLDASFAVTAVEQGR